MILRIFLSVILYFSFEKTYADSCANLFRQNANLPITHLLSAGAAHLAFSTEIEALLVRHSDYLKSIKGDVEEWDGPKYDAARKSFDVIENQVSAAILLQLTKDLPQIKWSYMGGNGTGQGQGALPNGAKSYMSHPLNYVEDWHRDAGDDVAKESLEAFLLRSFKYTILRVTIALPLGEVLPTLVRTVDGREVEGPYKVATAFFRNFIWHTTPQFNQDFRYLYIFDFIGRQN